MAFGSNIHFSQNAPSLISGPQYRHCVLGNAICSQNKIKGLRGDENLLFGFRQVSDLLQWHDSMLDSLTGARPFLISEFGVSCETVSLVLGTAGLIGSGHAKTVNDINNRLSYSLLYQNEQHHPSMTEQKSIHSLRFDSSYWELLGFFPQL